MNNVVVPVNYLAVFVVAILSMVIGALWYGPLFGKQWMKEMGWSKEKIGKKMGGGAGMSYVAMFIGALFMSYILAHAQIFASAYLKVTGVPSGLMTGFFNWLGFVAPVTLSSVLWEGKSKKLWLLNNGYYIVTLLAMGTLLAIWK